MNKRKRIETVGLLSAWFVLVVVAGSGLAGAQQSAPGAGSILAQSIAAPVADTLLEQQGPPAVTPRGMVPVRVVDEAETALSVDIRQSAVNRAYGFVVRAGESLRVRLDHPLQGYFTLVMVDRFGHPLPLTLERQRTSGVPQAFFVNTTDKDVAAYVVTTYPDWAYKQGDTCMLTITRGRR